MNMEAKKIYSGFRLVETKKVKEVNSDAHLFYHEKSGARLLFLENEEDNKVFSISFRTPPKDSTGVAHIIEHSVLSGSRKFRTKEPFVELVKGSLNTFLNAMTYPDKTMYPVASRNDKDFKNLMDVYLDAVFYPGIYTNPQVLMQEGWHYELEDKDSDMIYKGVVYNEMKGALSSPESVLEKASMEVLFPDTTYGVESGGDPEVIPELTQEEFLGFHKKYYHPSNSYIYLYGNVDILPTLEFLDKEYLSAFDKTEIDSEIQLQKPFAKPQERVEFYPVSAEEEDKDKVFLGLNFVVGQAVDPEIYQAFQVLEHILLGTPAAPLKKALVDAGIGKEVYGYFVPSIKQPVFMLTASGAKEEDKEKFVRTACETLEKLASQGIDKKLIEASINNYEFKLREANYGSYPKGLVYNIKCMDSWLYDADPLLHLTYEHGLAKIKTALETNYFEQLMQKYLLHNDHQAVIVLKPQKGLAEEKAAEVKKKLAEYKASLSQEELEKIVEQTKALKKRQETPDNEADLATIPLLDIKDIEPKAEKLESTEKHEKNVPVLFLPLFTNKIAYVNLYFDTRMVPQELLPYVYLLTEILGKVGTAVHDYGELSNEINIHTGGITYDAFAYSQKDSDEVYYPRFKVSAKSLVTKLPEVTSLLGEIMNSSRFDDAKRLKEIVQEVRAAWSRSMFSRGHQIAFSRMLSYFSPAARYNEQAFLSFYEFLMDLEGHFAAKADELAAKLSKVAALIFNRDNLLVGFTAEEADYAKFQEAFPRLYDALGQMDFHPVTYEFDFKAENEGLLTSGKVQYVAKGANFKRLGFAYHGSLKVLETIMRYDYLWNKIRAQGGAYGAFAKFERNGNMAFGSYRDPNLRETLTVYDETPAYLAHIDFSDREMAKYIIGTMSQTDMPLTAQMKGERAVEYYIRGISYDDVQKERDEILSTSPNDIKKAAELVEAGMKQNYLCVLGSEQKIKDNKDLFGKLVNVFS